MGANKKLKLRFFLLNIYTNLLIGLFSMSKTLQQSFVFIFAMLLVNMIVFMLVTKAQKNITRIHLLVGKSIKKELAETIIFESLTFLASLIGVISLITQVLGQTSKQWIITIVFVDSLLVCVKFIYLSEMLRKMK